MVGILKVTLEIVVRCPSRFAATCAVLAAPLLMPSGAAAQSATSKSNRFVLEEFDIANSGDLLLVPVKIDNATHSFILDTGCTTCVYDRTLEPYLGKKKRVVTAHIASGVDRFDLFEGPKAWLGGQLLSSGAGVLCGDARMHVQNKVTSGMVGMEGLRNRVVRINFDKGKVEFLSRMDDDDGHRIPLSWRQPRYGEFRKGPYVEVGIAGFGTIELLVDTGCVGPASGMLVGDFFDNMATRGALEHVGPISVPSSILGKLTTTRSGKVTMTLGDITQEGVFQRTEMNSLGLGYLSRYIVTFDFPNSSMYLREGAQFNRPDVYDLSGMYIGRKKGHTIIWIVAEGSEAANAGLRRNDRILRIHGEPAAKFSTFELRRLFCIVGKHRLSILRGDVEMEIELQLKDKPASASPGRHSNAGHGKGVTNQ